MAFLSRLAHALHLSSGAQVAAVAVVGVAVAGGIASLGRMPLSVPPIGAAGEGSLDKPPVEIRIRSPRQGPGLTNDSDGPLFVDLAMAPGSTSTKCMAVTNVGTRAADVRLYASIADGGLAQHVLFNIEAGTGGSFRECSLFRGRTIFEGSLRELARKHHDFASGLALPASVQPESSVSFRLSQQLNAATPQGHRATARFDWEARPVSTPAAEPGEVAGAAAGSDGNVASAQGGTSRGAESSNTGSGTRVPRGEAAEQKDVLEIAVRVLTEVAKRGWVWVVLLVLVIVFLVVQDRIDRRDPKLARARVYPEPDLSFERPAMRNPSSARSRADQ